MPRLQSGSFAPGIAYSSPSVSYTHLDVYKRQTLLGADDKAGVAEIMTALEQIIAEGTPHGDIWVGSVSYTHLWAG